tara:strand:- start:3239 stop:3721 length:483 start_codon:yes stop_codon:yes gene_type:complete
MHNKNNNKTRTYIQGLRPFSTSIPKTLKKYLKKGGYNYSNIIDNWTKIVSKNVYDSCYPIKIKMDKDMKDGILVLNVIHGKEVEIEYKKNEIIDKINCFFGYNCIKSIILKIVQDKLNVQDKAFPNIKNLKQIEEKMEKINNEQLKTSLNNFLKAYYDKY